MRLENRVITDISDEHCSSKYYEAIGHRFAIDRVDRDMGLHSAHTSSTDGRVNLIGDIVKEKPVFFDIGLGKGLPIAWAAHKGATSFGSDVSEEAVRLAVEYFSQLNGFIRGSIEVALGNSTYPDLPDLYNVPICGQKQLEQYDYSIDPYSTLGISPRDIDFFYHYQVLPTRHVLDFFSKYAKRGAWLLFATTFLEGGADAKRYGEGMPIEWDVEKSIRYYEQFTPRNVRLIGVKPFFGPHPDVGLFEKVG